MTDSPSTATPANAAPANAANAANAADVHPVADTVDVVVVGAGFAGLYMVHRLRQSGFSVQVFEAGTDLGGTWYWNRYPGARCDVESINYSYSFDKDLEQEWTWSERYATQPEILRYANHVADRFGLRSAIRFGTRVTRALYDDTTKRWAIDTDQGDRVSAQFCVMAVGCLSTSKTPEVPGIETFQGPWYHTGHWPHEGVDFTGKRVGIIGTGSSAIQSIPIIAQQAAHLTVFQRTPNFSMPAKNAPLDEEQYAQLKAIYPEWREQARTSGFGVPNELPERSALEVDAEDRSKRYEDGWEAGSLVGMLLAYNDLLVDKAANDTAAEFVRQKIKSIVKDPAVAELLAPKNHPLGTKRPCLDTGYYDTFNRDNVRLVDVLASPIAEIMPHGLRTVDEDFEFDALVFATGFDAMTGPLLGPDIRGRHGVSLREKWAAGPRTYLGLASEGFPNLFMITGPGSPSVMSNMMISIEQHVEWVSDCMAYARDHQVAAIEPTRDAEDAWVEHVNEAANATLYPSANSWYMGANVPGKPRVFMPYIGGVGVYREECDDVVANGYKGFVLTS
ncbi:MAG: cyclohexanone monooxygenase [Ilumatobacteraceae bacterium]|nr:cyclohexanone monooxygenase [Ilumatobacteraceae bacterium]